MSKTGHPLSWHCLCDYWFIVVLQVLLYFIFFMNLLAGENQVANDQERELILEQIRRQTKAGIPPGAQLLPKAARGRSTRNLANF